MTPRELAFIGHHCLPGGDAICWKEALVCDLSRAGLGIHGRKLALQTRGLLICSFPQLISRLLVLPHSSQYLVSSVFSILDISVCIHRYHIVISIFISLKINDAQYFFMSFLSIRVYLL